VGAARVDISDFSWSFPGQQSPALDALSMRLEPGERVLITGPSGSGKSTLAALLAGVLRDPDDGTSAGQMTVSGGRATGLVLQQPDDQTVMARLHDDVAFGLESVLMEPAEMQVRIDQALLDVGLDLPVDHPTRSLSGGQRQRLALAGALAMEPGLLVMDEPLSALDEEGASAVLGALERAVSARDLTLLVIDHNPGRWWHLVDRVLTIEGGRIVGGTPTPPSTSRDRVVPRPAPASAGEEILRVNELVVSRDGTKPTAQPLSFSVAGGGIVALRGPNGSGKTTAAMTLAGLLTPYAGSVMVGGVNPGQLGSEELSSLVGVVPQNPAHCFTRSSVRRELGPDAVARASSWGLSHVLDTHPLSLSGGQQRRLALALATQGGQKVLVLDEPSQSLDEAGIRELVAELVRALSAGVAVVMATHDDALVRALGAREIVVQAAPSPARAERPPGVLARVNPLALVGAALVPAVALLSTIDVVSAAVAVSLMAFLLPLLGRSVESLWTRLLPVALASIFSAVTIALYGQSSGEIHLDWGLVTVSDGSLSLALATALRILAIGGPAVLLFAQVDATRFADALSQQAKLPENFVVGGLAGLRLLEVVSQDREIRTWMMRARGMGDRGRFHRVVSMVLSLVVLAIRRSHTLAMAMEARAFGLHSTRSHYRRSVFPRSDYWWIVAGGMLGGLSVGAALLTGSFNAIL
jgi:energy-coupling factor transport system permease/ATP-binding protein